MEFITNSAMIVTALPSFKKEVKKSHGFAQALFGGSVTPIVTNPIGYQTFFISMTGALEGSDQYKEFESKRGEFTEFIDSFGFEDDSNLFQLIDLSYNEVGKIAIDNSL
ncbi:hypothetical protein [Enterococcus innesii]|uniref:hypothetical protein n=1 Tax=Enterococcus innesii TaxID=2839759 RepID=UPI002DBC7417|nr:hypothetical protein [Enterococcus innesii]MEB5953142.1 hypothetical protein [Enterococcus innesii]